MSGGAPLAEGLLSMDSAHNNLIPATGFIADIGSFFNIPAGEPLRVEVRAPEKAGRFWAFISVTNNVTQHVTIISPQ